MAKKKKKVIIYAGVGSPSWDTESNELVEVLEKEGYNVLKVIPVNGLAHPKIEYLPEE